MGGKPGLDVMHLTATAADGVLAGRVEGAHVIPAFGQQAGKATGQGSLALVGLGQAFVALSDHRDGGVEDGWVEEGAQAVGIGRGMVALVGAVVEEGRPAGRRGLAGPKGGDLG
jgi:hypothetical protein